MFLVLLLILSISICLIVLVDWIGIFERPENLSRIRFERFTDIEILLVLSVFAPIIEELTYGKIIPESKTYVLNVIQSFVDQDVKGVILGCTEFPLMINKEDLDIPIFNTTEIHAQAGVDYILKDYLE